MLQRTQLMLEDWQYETLKSRAERQGRSMSELVREILSAALYPPESSPGNSWLREIEGMFSDPDATGEDHDRYLYDDPEDLPHRD